jgi:hypothetical protein
MNAYLKVFAAIRDGGYDALAIVRAFQRLFPDEQEAIAKVAKEVFLGHPLDAPPELWVLNDAVRVGTSLFDQYRGIPRPPAFDLNAAARSDLVGVAGVDLALAERIMRAAPFSSIEDLSRVDGMPAAVVERFRAMRGAMLTPPTPGTAEEERLTLRTVLMPYAWRAGGAWILCAALGALLYGRIRRVRLWRLILNGTAAAGVALIAGWTVDPGIGVVALGAPVAVFGLPGAAIRGLRTRSVREALVVVLAWTAASVAAAVAVTPLF